MGYNRGGHRRTKRLDRHRREVRRLAAKAAGKTPAAGGKQAVAGKG